MVAKSPLHPRAAGTLGLLGREAHAGYPEQPQQCPEKLGEGREPRANRQKWEKNCHVLMSPNKAELALLTKAEPHSTRGVLAARVAPSCCEAGAAPLRFRVPNPGRITRDFC